MARTVSPRAILLTGRLCEQAIVSMRHLEQQPPSLSSLRQERHNRRLWILQPIETCAMPKQGAQALRSAAGQDA